MRAQQRIYEYFRYGWNTNIALDMVERFGTHFDVESRHPFLDRRLIEFCLGIPEEQRWSSRMAERDPKKCDAEYPARTN